MNREEIKTFQLNVYIKLRKNKQTENKRCSTVSNVSGKQIKKTGNNIHHVLDDFQFI